VRPNWAYGEISTLSTVHCPRPTAKVVEEMRALAMLYLRERWERGLQNRRGPLRGGGRYVEWEELFLGLWDGLDTT